MLWKYGMLLAIVLLMFLWFLRRENKYRKEERQRMKRNRFAGEEQARRRQEPEPVEEDLAEDLDYIDRVLAESDRRRRTVRAQWRGEEKVVRFKK